MMAKSILFLIATVIVNGIVGELSIPGPKIRFKLLTANVTGTPNVYLRNGEVIINPDGFSCTVHTDIVKEYPSNIMLKVKINYSQMEIPPMDLEACLAFHEQFFVKDVISKGKPKEKFPHTCPIKPGDYYVEDYIFPHYKIPPGTPPGPVEVSVELYIPDGESIMYLYATGVLELDLSDTPKLPLGK